MSNYTPVIYENEDGFSPFKKFFKDLPEHKQEFLEQDILGALSILGAGLCDAEPTRGTRLGGGIFELRTNLKATEAAQFYEDRPELTPPEGLGGDVMLRTFCHPYEDKILLLCGYDKGLQPKSNRQQKEIKRARGHLKAWNEAQKKQKAADRKRKPSEEDLAQRAKAAAARTFAAWVVAYKKAAARLKKKRI